LQHRVPLQILASRMVDRGASQVTQVLIKWSELLTDLATWEDYEALKHTFPSAPAWGQAGLQGVGNVDTVTSPAQDVGLRHSSRPTRRSVRISGPEWMN
jgi:hypothetical protein